MYIVQLVERPVFFYGVTMRSHIFAWNNPNDPKCYCCSDDDTSMIKYSLSKEEREKQPLLYSKNYDAYFHMQCLLEDLAYGYKTTEMKIICEEFNVPHDID